jgi:(+)-trans-carveol dehydrogenase
VGRLDGKVALVTGAARGQGRSHAIRLAQEGADIIAIDICAQVETVHFEMSTSTDLEETVESVEALDRRIVSEICDVRDRAALGQVVARGVAELGRLDVVVANAGISGAHNLADTRDDEWGNVIDINLTGVWNTLKASVPSILEGGRGGSVVVIGSYAASHGLPNLGPYTAAKHGVIGVMRSLATELGPHYIRVNAISPGNVGTKMLLNDDIYKVFRPDLEHPSFADVEEIFLSFPVMPIPYVEPMDISNAVVFLASDEARYITGVELPVGAGWGLR